MNMNANESAVTTAATRFYEEKDVPALEVLLGLRSNAIAEQPSLASDAELQLSYDEHLMGPLDELRKLARRVLRRWNEELNSIVCGQRTQDSNDRARLLSALSLGESAVIAAVVSILLALGVGPAIAAVVAPLLVKKFIWPAKDELCMAWREAIAADAVSE